MVVFCGKQAGSNHRHEVNGMRSRARVEWRSDNHSLSPGFWQLPCAVSYPRLLSASTPCKGRVNLRDPGKHFPRDLRHERAVAVSLGPKALPSCIGVRNYGVRLGYKIERQKNGTSAASLNSWCQTSKFCSMALLSTCCVGFAYLWPRDHDAHHHAGYNGGQNHATRFLCKYRFNCIFCDFPLSSNSLSPSHFPAGRRVQISSEEVTVPLVLSRVFHQVLPSLAPVLAQRGGPSATATGFR